MSEENRRREDRRRTLKSARIIFKAGNSTIDCIVRNLSDGGAKLTLASVIGVPNEFELLLTDGTSRQCQVRWRTMTELGVAFVT